MRKKKKTYNLKALIVSKLRQLSIWYPERAEALKEAQAGIGMYKCALCKEAHFKESIHVDHKEPVVGLDGFTTWDNYIARMFCRKENFQVVCHFCHTQKTDSERKKRFRKETNEKDSNKEPIL